MRPDRKRLHCETFNEFEECGRFSLLASISPRVRAAPCVLLLAVAMWVLLGPLSICEDIPMIVGTGIDIAEVPRVAAAITRFGNRFLQRIYTEGEIRYCESKANRVERYAARFAAKEAAMKALGTGWNHGVRWRDVEVCRQPGGRPTIVFHGKAAEHAARLGAAHVALSLSHTAEQAIAQVILES